MPRKSEYFTDDLILRTAQDFAVSYHNRNIYLTTTTLSKVNARERIMKEKPKPPANYETAQERAEWETAYLVWKRRLDAAGYTEVMPVLDEDERFADLDKLAAIVSRREEADDDARKKAEKRLYAMALLMKKEGRIRGDFSPSAHTRPCS